MDWLFENLGKLAPVVIFLLYMISSFKKKEGDAEEPFDPEAAERSRKIQEEIRRKILERQRGGAGPTARPPSQEYSPQEEPQTAFAPFEPTVFERQAQPEPSVEFDEWEELSTNKYSDLEEQLAAAEKLRDLTKRRAADFLNGPAESSVASSSAGLRSRLRAGLESPDSLKSSVLLMEVLGKPVGLR